MRLSILRLWVLSALMVAAATAVAQDAKYLEGPGEEISGPVADIYGFAMVDMGYNAGRIDPDWFDVMRPTKLPKNSQQFGKDGSTYFSVRQSRFGIKYWQPTSKQQVRGIFEWELFGVGEDAGETTFRLRHAYLQYGQFGAGQYHSVFMDIDIFPDSVEYWGPTGMILYRNIQVRWMPVMGEKNNVAISLERPGASGDGGEYDEIFFEQRRVEGRFPVPDLAAHYRRSEDWGHVQIAGILRNIQWDDNSEQVINPDPNDPEPLDFSGRETGYGINLTTNIRLGRGVFKGGFIAGKGIQNYLNDGSADIAVTPGDADSPGGVKVVPVLAFSAFYDYPWNDSFTSTIGFSAQDLDYKGTASLPDTFVEGQYALANIIYYPVKPLMTALELQYGRRKNFNDGWDYDAWRIQFSAKYKFSFRLGG